MMIKRILVAAIPLLMVGTALAQAPTYTKGKSYGFIESSANKHNFSQYGWADNQICKPCHTPHDAKPVEISDRLWAHTVTTATYKLGEGVTEGAETYLDRVSRLCMSCHDGSLAPGDYRYSPQPSGGSLGSNYIIGGADHDLARNHPVGKGGAYPDLSRMKKPTVTTSSTGSVSVTVDRSVVVGKDPGTGKDITTTVKLPLQHMLQTDSAGKVTLDAWSVGCSTCHHPHGTRVAADVTVFPPGTDPEPHLLRMSNGASSLCLTCHNK